MHRLKVIISGIWLSICMLNGASDVKDPSKFSSASVSLNSSEKYSVNILRQKRLPCGLSRLMCGNAQPIIMNKTHHCIPIKYHKLDVIVPYYGEKGKVQVDVDYFLNAGGTFKGILLCSDYLSGQYQIPKKRGSCCAHMECPHAEYYTCEGQNPKGFTLMPGHPLSKVYALKPGFIYQIVEQNEKERILSTILASRE
jgi:hypothetical protein